MKNVKQLLSAFSGGFRAELLQMFRSPLLVGLAIIQAITFLLLVSLFGLTGSMAPTALINYDTGPYSKAFIESLQSAHHSFDLRPMDEKTATAQLEKGKLVASIVIPKGFSDAIFYGQTAPINVRVDNIDVDMTDDIQRALPSAIVGFGRATHLPNISVDVTEHDLIDHDTGFIPYLVVSALALDAFVVAGILSASAVAREFETGTIKLLSLSRIHPLIPLVGRVFAANTIAFLGLLLSVFIVVLGYNVIPVHPWEMLGALIISIIIFGCVGALVGILLRRTLPIAPLIFGLSLPLYIDSGSLEPERFDGNIIWAIAHLSPIYYSVGILEHAFHNFQVTPEPIFVDFLFLLGWAALMIFCAGYYMRRNITV